MTEVLSRILQRISTVLERTVHLLAKPWSILTNLSLDGILFELSTRATHEDIPYHVYYSLLAHFQQRLPQVTLCSHIVINPAPGMVVLLPKATFFDHVIIKGFRYRPSSRVTSIADSLVAVKTSDLGALRVAELVSIFSLNQVELGGVRTYGQVRWYDIADLTHQSHLWNTLYVAHSKAHIYWPFISSSSSVHVKIYKDPNQSVSNISDSFIDLSDIQCPVVWFKVDMGGQVAWAMKM